MNGSYTFKLTTPTQETFTGRVKRMAIILQCRILEIVDSSDSVFYLLYFKNTLLGGGKVEEVKPETFLYKAFDQGITIDPTHPLFSVLLPSNRKASIPDTKSLFTDLQNSYSLHEVAFAATYMDHFIEKQQVIHIIREIYNHFRRNGQLLKAYLTAKILFQYSPQLKLAKELVRNLEFDKYRKIEEVNPLTLYEQDPLFLESFFFFNQHKQNYEPSLHQLLNQQSRQLERLLLFIHQYQLNKEFSNYDEFIKLLQQELKVEDQYKTLKFLWECSPQSPRLVEELIHEQIRLNMYTEAIELIIHQPSTFIVSHYKIIEQILEFVDPTILVELPNISQIISQLYPSNPSQKDKVVRCLIPSLLSNHDPNYAKKWLEPIERNTPNLQVCRDISQLVSLSQNMDQLPLLGETYYRLGLLDQSIECFTWEMELNPNSITPVRWLNKIYLEKGMREEADGYRQLSVSMAKRG